MHIEYARRLLPTLARYVEPLARRRGAARTACTGTAESEPLKVEHRRVLSAHGPGAKWKTLQQKLEDEMARDSRPGIEGSVC